MRKIIVLVSMVLLIGTCIIGSTLAYLSATSKSLANEFTGSDISVTIKETENDYVIVPGNTDAKDPTVTVEKGSEKCYVFAAVKNEFGEAVIVNYNFPNATQKGWVEVSAAVLPENVRLYVYSNNTAAEVVDAKNSAVEIAPAVFSSVKYDTSIVNGLTTGENPKKVMKYGDTVIDDFKISIRAYAYQAYTTDNTTTDPTETSIYDDAVIAAIAWAKTADLFN